MRNNKIDLKVFQKEDLENKICVLMGTRPSIIKMSPIVRILRKLKLSHFVIHAGQHYDNNLNDSIYADMDIPKPDFFLKNVQRYRTHATQTAAMMVGIEEILIKERPKIVLVCADANFNLAGALAARKLNIYVGHVEAGLRSNDWRMPEEHNRVMIDHISEFLFCPTEEAKKSAMEDKVKGHIVVTGNTIVDSIKYIINKKLNRKLILTSNSFNCSNYVIITLHREETVDNRISLQKAIRIFKDISERFNYSFIFPVHPRTYKRLKQYNMLEDLKSIKNMKLIEPLSYKEFIKLLLSSKFVLTDSGGIQEEACILKIPCITLRDNTERPETVKCGANIIAGLNARKVIEGIIQFENSNREWEHIYGQGDASKKIINTVVPLLK